MYPDPAQKVYPVPSGPNTLAAVIIGLLINYSAVRKLMDVTWHGGV